MRRGTYNLQPAMQDLGAAEIVFHYLEACTWMFPVAALIGVVRQRQRARYEDEKIVHIY